MKDAKRAIQLLKQFGLTEIDREAEWGEIIDPDDKSIWGRMMGCDIIFRPAQRNRLGVTIFGPDQTIEKEYMPEAFSEKSAEKFFMDLYMAAGK